MAEIYIAIDGVKMKKIIRKCSSLFLRAKGYSSYISYQLYDEIIEDFFENKKYSIFEKIWAYRHGFLSDKLGLYNLNSSNYKNYLSDFAYYKMHPINGRYSAWIDDKLTLRYTLYNFSDYLPDYYFQLNKGTVLKLADCPSYLENEIDGIIELLREKEKLAVKLLSGGCGIGFYKLSFKNKEFYLNNVSISLHDLKSFLNSLESYLITEYIEAHDSIRKIYDVTPNALRIVTINPDKEEPRILFSLIRFGNAKTGMVDNTYAGWLFSKINIDNGAFENPKMYIDGKAVSQLKHPDTGVDLTGTIPYWPTIKEKTIEIAKALPQLVYMGFDVIVTNNGLKIIEINSLPAITSIQEYVPFMEEEESRRFFTNILERNTK